MITGLSKTMITPSSMKGKRTSASAPSCATASR
jgi:hypothetical protein